MKELKQMERLIDLQATTCSIARLNCNCGGVMIIHSSQNPYKVLAWNNTIGDFYTIAWATNRQEAEDCAKAHPVRAIVRDSFDMGSLVFDNKKEDFI